MILLITIDKKLKKLILFYFIILYNLNKLDLQLNL